MSTELREVRLEVCVNCAFSSADSYWASDDQDVQMEFEITDAIYSASQKVDVQLKVLTDDRVTVSYCRQGEKCDVDVEEHCVPVREVKDLQMEMNRNDSISELESEDLSDPAGPSVEMAKNQGGLDADENSPTKSTAGWMFRKMSAVFQRLTAIFHTNKPNAVEEPEVDQIDPEEESCVPDPRAPKPKPEVDLVDTEQSCVPKPETDPVDAEQSCVPEPIISEPEPETDPVDAEQSCVPEPIISEPEPETDPVDAEQSCVPEPIISEPEPETDPVDAEQSCVPEPIISEPEPETDKVDAEQSCVPEPIISEPEPETDPVDAEQSCVPEPIISEPEPETDPVDAEQSCVPEPVISEPEPETDKVDAEQSCVPEPIISEPEPETDLVDAEQSCVPESIISEPEPETDLVDAEQSCVPEPIISEPEPETDLVDAEQSCVPEPIISEPEPETDLVDAEQSCVPEPIISEPEPETDLVDAEQSCVPDPSVPEMDLVDTEQSCVPEPSILELEPEVDLVDPEQLCVPDPSVPEPKPEVASELSRLENYFPLNVWQLQCRFRDGTMINDPATEVWPRVFIGNEEIARDRDKLKEMGITHILNAAAPKKTRRFWLGKASEEDLQETVDTGSRYYKGMHITYCGLPSSHVCCFDISQYFLPAARFIRKALRNPTNKVLIHCTEGLSYSVTLFIAYLMICHDMKSEEAIDHIIKVS